MQKQKESGGPSSGLVQKAADGSGIAALAEKASAKAKEALARINAAIEEGKTQGQEIRGDQKVLICGVCYVPGCCIGPMEVMTVAGYREGFEREASENNKLYSFQDKIYHYSSEVPKELLEAGIKDYKDTYGEG